jgi:hypothetical protein
MAATTFRRDVRAALVSILEAQKTATPGLLKRVTPVRDGGLFPEVPCAYVSDLTETITWTAGTRTRAFEGAEVTIVDTYREGSADTLDQLADLLVDRFNDARSVIPNAIVQLSGVRDTEIPVDGPERITYYRGVVLTLRNTAKWEGRS